MGGGGVIRRHFLLGVFAVWWLVACGQPSPLPAIPPGQTVLAFGDSVTFGTGAARGEDWPSLLAAATGWKVVNAGIPGDTAAAGKSRIGALLGQYRPALVIIEMGGNDFLQRRSAATIKEDLRIAIRAARQAGAQVVLVGVPEFSLLRVVIRRASDSPLYAELAEEEGVSLVSDVFSEVLAHPELCADAIHPNAAGYRQMAVGIYERLKALGLIAAGGH